MEISEFSTIKPKKYIAEQGSTFFELTMSDKIWHPAKLPAQLLEEAALIVLCGGQKLWTGLSSSVLGRAAAEFSLPSVRLRQDLHSPHSHQTAFPGSWEDLS